MSKKKKVIPFPTPPPEPIATTYIVQIGDQRFAIHWEIEDLPRAERVPRLCDKPTKPPRKGPISSEPA
jgi:hypothetical protein